MLTEDLRFRYPVRECFVDGLFLFFGPLSALAIVLVALKTFLVCRLNGMLRRIYLEASRESIMRSCDQVVSRLKARGWREEMKVAIEVK
jgi:hypothetical protein